MAVFLKGFAGTSPLHISYHPLVKLELNTLNQRQALEMDAFAIFGVCDYGGHCLSLAKQIKESTPEANIVCKRGRQGSFEVMINNQLVYSKLQTMALPDYDEVKKVVSDAAAGEDITQIKKEQPVECVIS